MEQWEALIDACPAPVDLRYFCKAIQTAEVVFKEDLASFEKEWILQTLLHKPVSLLDVVATKRTDVAWFKPIGDSFKLLAGLIDRQTEADTHIERHLEDIVHMCLLKFDAQIRNHALHCLTSIAKVSALGARDVSRHVQCLEEGTTGKAPLALLVGTICEYHPETVENDINIIWRHYLKLLDSSKNTSKVTGSILEGIFGVFKHFGCDLPVAELYNFYDKIVSDYIRIPSCENVCLRILSEYSNLFRERISKDVRIRNFLWNTLHNSTGTTVVGINATNSVYKSVFSCLQKEQIQRIATTEIVPQIDSKRAQVKYTALRLLTYIQTNCNVNIAADRQTDTASLEYELRRENVSYDVAEAVAWCIESAIPGCDKLLQTAVLFYSNLPANRRKDIVVHGILNSKAELRSLAILFLISESTQNNTSLDVHLPLWKDLFDNENGKDLVVVDKSRLVFEDFMGYVVFVLENFLEQGIEKTSEKLTTLLQLTTQVLTYQSKEDYTNDYCIVLLPLLNELLKLNPDAVIMSAVRCAISHIIDQTEHRDILKEIYQVIDIDRCKDEALLCESCLLLVRAPDDIIDTLNVMMALQILFSRNDVEPQILCESLKKLENIIILDKYKLDASIYNDILHNVGKIVNRQEMSGKPVRILRRELLMFLGKYGTKTDENNKTENTILVKLMDSLVLSVANPNEGTSFVLNLQRILQLALEHGDPSSLQTFLILICANLSTKREPNLQLALAVTCPAVATAHSRGSSTNPRSLQAALAMCDSVQSERALLQYISVEKSPGVRKMLSDGLEVSLVRDRECVLINTVAEQAEVMMKSEISTTKRAGLNITETLISSLKDNNSSTKELLPKLLVLISETFEIDSEMTFETGSKHFLEKIELFENEDIEKLIKRLLSTILNNKNKMADVSHYKMAESEVRIFKITTKMILDFIKNVTDYKKEDFKKIWCMIFEILTTGDYDFEKTLYVLAKYKSICAVTSDIDRTFLNKMFSMELDVREPYFTIDAILIFLKEYEGMLLELYYQETVLFLAKIITVLTPASIKYLHRTIKSCLSAFTNKNTPAMLQSAFERWCAEQPLPQITNNIENKYFSTANSITVLSLKIMLEFFDIATLTELSLNAQKWPKILLKLFSDGYIDDYLKSKMAYLTDILAVSVRFLKMTDIRKLISEGSSLIGLPTEKVGLRFCRFFMHVFYDVFLSKPRILLEGDMANCCILLNDIVKYTIKKKCTDDQYDIVLELVIKLWPTYESRTNFEQKYHLLLDLNNFPKKLDRDSNPLQWADNNVLSEGSREEKAKLIGVLPGGTHYSQAYRAFASTLPTRLSELAGGHYSLVALLDALASTRDLVLLDIVMTLAGGDDTKGWWDDAIDSCMASIAGHGDLALCKAVFTRSWVGLSMGVCRRVLLPLLRYSTSSFNEDFFSTTLDQLLVMKVTPASNHRSYHKNVIDHIRHFTILQVACEKISPTSLESPNSNLYKRTKPTQSWYLIRETCKKCYSLRNCKLHEDANETLREDFRQLQCANYNCFAAAVCRMRPKEAIYKQLFDVHVWDSLVDPNKEYSLPIKHFWNQRSTRQPVSIDVPEASMSVTKGSARTATARSRVFLRTLSECPLMYDLIEQETEEEIITQDLQLPSSQLNSHPCCAVLTALVCHAMTSHPACVRAVAAGLGGGGGGARWLLAQVVCNCKEELKPLASTLRPALLEVVATTPIESNGKKILNGLHIEILETIFYWGDDHPSPSPNLNNALELLLNTGVEHKQHKYVYKTITDVITKYLEIYSEVVSVNGDLYEPYLQDPKTPKALLIHIPSVLPTLLTELENKHYKHLTKCAEIIGLTLKRIRGGERQRYLARFRKILDQVRQHNGSDYVKLLFYTQSACAECCDEFNFRMTTDLTQKLVGSDKSKCLQILTTFIRNSPSTYIQEMYESIDIPDLLIQGNLEAFSLVSAGVGVMSDSVKKRLVTLAAKCCQHSLATVRARVADVTARALEDLLASPDEPTPKRTKTIITALISKILSKDVYTNTVVSSLACCCVDTDGAVSGKAREGVAKMLHKDMGTRFVESFLITAYLPPSDVASRNYHECLLALIDMMLSDLKSQERFRNIKLRDEPLEVRSDNTRPSKLLTMSRSYQGTFRRRAFTSKTGPQAQDVNVNSPEIDVQITIDSILDTFVQFSKNTPQAAQALCLELIQAVKPNDLGKEMAQALAAILDTGVNELTPFVVEVCLIYVDDLAKVDGIKNTIKNLLELTNNSEGEYTIQLLYKEVRLRCDGPDQFVLGCLDEEELDVVMEGDAEFCIEDLTSAFGKLSNWDNLTIQEKCRVQANGVPPLWTDKHTFRKQLESYKGNVGWFSKMAAAYKREDKENVIKWLREIDRWPRGHFRMSAITEAIEWQVNDRPKIVQCDIEPSDCLAEWAARLMIRSAYNTSLPNSESSQEITSSRSHELKWCVRANEMQLGASVLACVKRNIPNLTESETLPWLHQKVLAQRSIGLQINNNELLTKALTTAVKYTPDFLQDTTTDVVFGINKLILELNRDVNTLSSDTLQQVFETIQSVSSRSDYGNNKNGLLSIYEIAMTYYNDQWENDADTESEQNRLISDMTDILEKCTEIGLYDEGLFAMVINKLDEVSGTLSEPVTRRLLNQIQRNISHIDDITLQQLSRSNLFPSRSFSAHPFTNESEDAAIEKYKRCLQLLCDTEYTLLQYCRVLSNALKKSDEDEWEATFKRMKEKLFENPYSGSDYQLLNRYKSKLYEISEYDMSPSFKVTADNVLKEIRRLLSQRPPATELRVSQLCPTLSVSDHFPSRLLGLDDGSVVRLAEQVTIFHSIRRPTLFKVILSNGTSKRYLHKTGESLKVDAAAQKVMKHAGRLWKGKCPVVGYNVIPLSEDCGLIEFLEDHDTLRSMIGAEPVVLSDHELIFSPIQANLARHQQLCDKIPSSLLRHSIMRRSVSVQDRIFKMRNYEDTLASNTVMTWLLGVDDRHLENILYSIQDGRLCHIDWGGVFVFGASEIPPARLTRNLMAACDERVLEARLQQLLTRLRESRDTFLAVINVSFKWMGEKFIEKYPYIKQTLYGSIQSYDVSRAVIQQSAPAPNRDKLLGLLDRVFEQLQQQRQYSVQQQISCLLRHCTDPQILCITRSGWEPWV